MYTFLIYKLYIIKNEWNIILLTFDLFIFFDEDFWIFLKKLSHSEQAKRVFDFDLILNQNNNCNYILLNFKTKQQP